MADEKKWDKGRMVELLDGSDEAVRKGLLALYSKQTESEQASQMTKELNEVGFNAFDAEFLSSLAEQLKEKGYLSKRQTVAARKALKKYWRQLCAFANREIAYSLA